MQNGWRQRSHLACMLIFFGTTGPTELQLSPSLSALTLNYLGVLPTASHLLSLSAQTILSARRSVSLHPNNPLRHYPRSPAGDSVWLTRGVFQRETLCVNSICWYQPYFPPSSTEAASCCSTSYRCLSNARLSGETACIFVVFFSYSVLL